MNDPRYPNGSNDPQEPQGYEWEYPKPPPPARPSRPVTPNPEPARRAQQQPYPTLPNNPPERPYVSRGTEYNPPVNTNAVQTPGGSSRRVWLTRLAVFALGSLLVLVCGGGLLVAGVYAYYANELPPADQLATANTDQSTKIYDRNGGLLYEIVDPNLGRHTIISPDKIPTVLRQATLATEDPSFYDNPGVDWYALARAMYYFVRYQRPVSGASTITQQLMKTVFLSPEQTPERKIKEAILAIEVTRRYTKDEILAFYLNTINYGNRSYGIQAAAQSYFAKDVGQLDLAETSLLAGLPQLPAIYDPCINPDKALERQAVVLSLMQEQGYITQQQTVSAAQEMHTRLASDEFTTKCQAGLTYARAPHFVEYVRQQLEEKYEPATVYRGGLQVYTTLDPQIQTIVEEEARSQIAALKGKNVNSAAAVVVNPQNGEIYAMLGSVDFNDKDIDGQVNVATRPRQPGSSIKPLNYLAAFEHGWTPATPLYDIKTEFPDGVNPPYVPKNYDGKEHGLVTVRTALANSYNIPAVKTLSFVGVPQLMGIAQRFGITTLSDPTRYGLSLTLGGGEVKLVELTGAYAAIANEGRRAPLTPFTKIIDGTGRVIYDTSRTDASAEQVTDARYAYQLMSILSDNAARTPAFGPNSPLKTSRPAFVKTGTTDDYKDNWTLGGTPELVIGVWVGNPRNEAMQNVSGVTGAAPIWHNVLERVYQESDAFKTIAPHDFPIPGGLVQAEVCNESGLVPTEACPADHHHNEIFLNNQAPNQFDTVWTKLRIDTTNGQLAGDNCPPEIIEERVFANLIPDVVLPYDRIREWGAGHGYPISPIENSPCNNNAPVTQSPTQARIDSPREGEPVSGIISVDGYARVPQGGAWILEVGRNGQWVTLATGGAEANGMLGQFDANAFGDGELDIRLTATNEFGQPTEAKVRVIVQPYVPPPTATEEPTKKPKKTKVPDATATIFVETVAPTEPPTTEPTIEPTEEATVEPTVETPATETPAVAESPVPEPSETPNP